MDFLDPSKRRAYNIRLIIGYFLLTIAILLGTIILVYAAYGFGINTKTGQIIQNGLIFVDSQPSGAKIELNGKDINSTTSARLVTESGKYSLSLTKQGYRQWTKDFTLDEHSIQRFTYPLLIPEQPVVKVIKDYAGLPAVITQSPDKHWVVALEVDSATGVSFLDEVDTSNPSKAVNRLAIPAGVFRHIGGSFAAVEWSTDNSHFLISHTFDGGSEFALLNRANIADSQNINGLLNQNPAKVSLVNKKGDQLYIYDNQTRDLKIANVSKATLSPALLKNVVEYKSLANNLIIYVTDAGVAAGQVEVHLFDGSSDYKLSTINQKSSYVLDATTYQGHWYYAVTSVSGSSLNIYEDPISDIKNPAIEKAIVVEALSLPAFDNVSFSSNGRFLVANQSNSFVGYDFDSKTKFKFGLSSAPLGGFQWLDNYHLGTTLLDNLTIMDFDGANQQALAPDTFYLGAHLSKDAKHLIILKASAAGSPELNDLSLQAAN